MTATGPVHKYGLDRFLVVGSIRGRTMHVHTTGAVHALTSVCSLPHVDEYALRCMFSLLVECMQCTRGLHEVVTGVTLR